ncbi:hypothetical protein [Alkalibacterium sp.]|nr:MAG: hypothetical protein EA249_09690 [Alkalibacterium sp.]
MTSRERIIFGLKTISALVIILTVLNLNPIDQLNLWMQMGIGALIGVAINDFIDKVFSVTKDEESNQRRAVN